MASHLPASLSALPCLASPRLSPRMPRAQRQKSMTNFLLSTHKTSSSPPPRFKRFERQEFIHRSKKEIFLWIYFYGIYWLFFAAYKSLLFPTHGFWSCCADADTENIYACLYSDLWRKSNLLFCHKSESRRTRRINARRSMSSRVALQDLSWLKEMEIGKR